MYIWFFKFSCVPVPRLIGYAKGEAACYEGGEGWGDVPFAKVRGRPPSGKLTGIPHPGKMKESPPLVKIEKFSSLLSFYIRPSPQSWKFYSIQGKGDFFSGGFCHTKCPAPRKLPPWKISLHDLHAQLFKSHVYWITL